MVVVIVRDVLVVVVGVDCCNSSYIPVMEEVMVVVKVVSVAVVVCACWNSICTSDGNRRCNNCSSGTLWFLPLLWLWW